MYDVIIVGGSYSGMAAALQLLRARRTVLVIDAGQRRCGGTRVPHSGRRRSHRDRPYGPYATHGLPDPDVAGCDYNGSRAVPGRFLVTTSDSNQHESKRLILATGVSDTLPEIPGLAERWGKSAFHCPYCHGYELDMGRIGVIATGPNSLHQALLLREWGEVTFFLNSAFEPGDAASATLAERGVAVEVSTIVKLENHADVCLEDGRRLSFVGLFTASSTTPATPLAENLGCELESTPIGVQIKTEEGKQTSVAGVFACGDVAHMPHSLTFAVSDGALTGLHVHRSLVF